MNKVKRVKMVAAMEFIMRNLNNEELIMDWLRDGVADGDINYGDMSPDNDELYIYTDDDVDFAEIMHTFTEIMAEVHNNGGLYCDGVCSDYKEGS